MSSTFNEALERASNPQMPPPKSPREMSTSPSRTSTLFQDKIKETVVTVPGPSPVFSSTSASASTSSSSTIPRPSTPRPTAVGRDVYASGALPPLHCLLPTEEFTNDRSSMSTSTSLPNSIPIPPFKSTNHGLYISNYSEDGADWAEPTPPLPLPTSDPGPCRNFRDPYAAATEERERHFAMQRQKRLETLISASDALRDGPALPSAGPDGARVPSFDQPNEQGGSDRGFAGEIGSVYVPNAWQRGSRSRSKANASTGGEDIFSDAAEDGGDTDTDDEGSDEEEWSVEFARAEVEVSDALEDGRAWPVGYEQVGPEELTYEYAGMLKEVDRDRPPPSAPGAAVDPAIATKVKHMPLTAMRDRVEPATSAPSPTESQLVASGFEFHNELSEEEQIARFGDKAFRKALREVLPSLSRKQQWYAWQRVNEEHNGDGADLEKAGTPEKTLKQETRECECDCPRNGQECGGHDGTCGKLLNECRRGDWRDHDEHCRWHHADGAYEAKGELGEEMEGGTMPKCVCGKEGKAIGERLPGSTEQDCTRCQKRPRVKREENGKPDTWTCACGCAGDGSSCPYSLPGCYYKESPRSQVHQHPPAWNPDVATRPSDWTGLFDHGRLIDGERPSRLREELDLRHDVPALPTPGIPGLGMLDPPSNPQPTYDSIRRSVEPETPRRQLYRGTTPAFEDRSPSPSPVSAQEKLEDVEMTDVPTVATPAPQASRLPLPQPTSSPDPLSSPMHAVTAPQIPVQPRSQSRSRSKSPTKAPVTAPDPSTPKSTKRGGRRKSAVQGSKVEKTSTNKSRAVSRKVAVAVKNVAEKGGGKVKEAVARIEASVKGEQELTPRRSVRIKAMGERAGTVKG